MTQLFIIAMIGMTEIAAPSPFNPASPMPVAATHETTVYFDCDPYPYIYYVRALGELRLTVCEYAEMWDYPHGEPAESIVASTSDIILIRPYDHGLIPNYLGPKPRVYVTPATPEVELCE